jgi:virginiamycin B lyase
LITMLAALRIGIVPAAELQRMPVTELKVTAKTHLGKTADWVAVAPDAVWVGSTGPFAVHRLDPESGRLIASVVLRGEPCAGLVVGFDSLWVPLCGPHPGLAQVDTRSNRLTRTLRIAPAGAEGGIAAGADSLWMMTDRHGSLARIDPVSGRVRQTIHVPAGSYNPRYVGGSVWVTRAAGAKITIVDGATGQLGTAVTGPGPRFLTDGADAVWTLNQGDGSLTRIENAAGHTTHTVALGTPGHGGDIAFAEGMIWTTMPKVPLSAVAVTDNTLRCQWLGDGGDSLGIGHGALWLTDYHAGTIWRIDLADTLRRCAAH